MLTITGIAGNVILDKNADRDPDFLILYYGGQVDHFQTWTSIGMYLPEGEVSSIETPQTQNQNIKNN